MVTVDGVPAPAEIVIIPIRGKHVIDIIVNSFEREKRSVFIAFRSMIENNVQNDFNAILFLMF